MKREMNRKEKEIRRDIIYFLTFLITYNTCASKKNCWFIIISLEDFLNSKKIRRKFIFYLFRGENATTTLLLS